MQIGVLGISYKSASLEVREKVAKAASFLFVSLGYVVLSTCHRTEIYFSGDDLAEIHTSILGKLKEVIDSSFEPCLYAFFGKECFFHLAKVTAGMDSAIIGESDIQRQVKTAYLYSCKKESLSSCLHFLFQKSLKIGKNIRTFFQASTDLEHVLARFLGQFFGSWKGLKIFFLGYSETNRKIIQLLSKEKAISMTLCTTFPQEAESFALDHRLSLLGKQDVDKWKEFSAVISATHNSEEKQFLIDDVKIPVATQLMIDLSVPRTLNPALNSHPNIRLLNMEQMVAFAKTCQEDRKQEILYNQKVIENCVKRQSDIFHSKQQYRRTCGHYF